MEGINSTQEITDVCFVIISPVQIQRPPPMGKKILSFETYRRRCTCHLPPFADPTVAPGTAAPAGTPRGVETSTCLNGAGPTAAPGTRTPACGPLPTATWTSSSGVGRTAAPGTTARAPRQRRRAVSRSCAGHGTMVAPGNRPPLRAPLGGRTWRLVVGILLKSFSFDTSIFRNVKNSI